MAELKLPANDDLARAMFYLYCTTAACGLDVLPRDLVDYENYATLPNARRQCVLLAACAFAPAVMKRRTLFEDVDRMFLDRRSRLRIVPFDEARGLLRARPIVRLRGVNASLTAVVVVQRLSYADFLLRGVALKVTSSPTSSSFTSSSSSFSAPTCNNVLARALRAHCSHCLWRGPCQCVTYGGKTYACTRPCYARCAPFPANLWTHRNHCAHCMGHAGKCRCRRSCERPKGVSCFRVISGVCDECVRKVNKVVVCQFACCDEPVRVCEVCFNGQAFIWWHAFCERDRSLHSPLLVPQRRTFVPITTAAPVIPLLPAPVAGCATVYGNEREPDLQLQSDQVNNQLDQLLPSGMPTAGDTSAGGNGYIDAKRDDYDGIVDADITGERERYDDHYDNRDEACYSDTSHQPTVRFGATKVIECTKSFTRHSSTATCTTTPAMMTSGAVVNLGRYVPKAIQEEDEGATSRSTTGCLGNCVASRFVNHCTSSNSNHSNSIDAQHTQSINSTTSTSEKGGFVGMRRMGFGSTHHRSPLTPADRPITSSALQAFPSHGHRMSSAPLSSRDASLPFRKGDRVKLINLGLSDIDGATGVVIIPRAKPGRVGIALTNVHDTRVVFVKIENLTFLPPLHQA